MNIQAEKLSIIQQLLMTQDEKLITAVKKSLEYAIRYPGNTPENLPPCSFIRKPILETVL